MQSTHKLIIRFIISFFLFLYVVFRLFTQPFDFVYLIVAILLLIACIAFVIAYFQIRKRNIDTK